MHMFEYQGLHGSCSGWVEEGVALSHWVRGYSFKGSRVAGFPIKAHRDWRSVSGAQQKQSL